MNKISQILIAFLTTITVLQAQNKNIITSRNYPQGYFRNPLNIEQDASGTFGELRSTHFHAGDDYRTQQRIGLPLHAAAEGYVSRVRVQIGGGGNSVYITHPNGFSTVYLHMEDFNDALTAIVREEQYKLKRFDVDIPLTEERIKLSKGQFIGRAGNTGGSGGPHLHFEIRESASQKPLNPQLFGLKFKDQFAPTIQGLMIYDLQQSYFNEQTGRRAIPLKAAAAGRYTLSNNQAIPVNGKFGLGINTIDRHRAGGFQNGVYSIELFLDGKAISTVIFEELDFSTSSAIHSYIDYPQFKKTKSKIQKSFKDPGNPIQIFKHLDQHGIIELTDNAVHEVKYVVKDVQGNCSELNFSVQNSANYKPKEYAAKGTLFSYNKSNSFESEDINLQIPEGALYTDVDFTYQQAAPLANSYSNVHHVHNTLTPLFSTYHLKIKPTSLPPQLESKALISSVESGSIGGKFEDGYVSVNTKLFGSFYITVDTIPPTIIARNLTHGKRVSNQAKLSFSIADNFSGIQSFNAYIDDQWVLMEYDSKTRHVWHTFTNATTSGTHKFKLVVNDWKDNEQIYEASFIR
ncbi:M23 family metallopeptidase [Sphingobacterium sp. HJSM2_6]|uniref:M23 family metallopeptidase n=1 Tax=Sphingobacterium sp. HJSM2_6 TaxID=3366264 RepID=UPI003BD1EBDB